MLKSPTTSTLTIASADLRRMMRELTATNRPCAIASINANCDLEHTYWSATEFRSCRDWPTGQDFPLRHDWLALVPTPAISHDHAHHTIQRLQPLPGHNLIVLAVGSGSVYLWVFPFERVVQPGLR